jgi:hypothetical protein
MVLSILALLLMPRAATLPDLHSQAENETSRIASSLWHYQYPLLQDEIGAPSPSDPFNFASLHILAAHPSVSGEISSRHPPLIYWIWGESHVQSLNSEKPSGKCPPGAISIEQAGKAKIGSMLATYSTPAMSLSVPITGSPATPAILPGDLEIEPWAKPGSNKSVPIFLNITITAAISAPYIVRETDSQYLCSEKCTAQGCTKICSCIRFSRSYRREFTRLLSDSQSYPIQPGSPSFLLSSPPLGYALAYSPSIRIIILSSREPSEIRLFSNGSQFAWFVPFSYNISRNGFGASCVDRAENNASGSLIFEARHLSALQLSPKNTSAFFLLASPYPNSTGRSNLSMVFYDEFGDLFDYSAPIVLRLPSQFIAQNASLAQPEKSAATLQAPRSPNRPAIFHFQGSDDLLPYTFAFPQEMPYANLGALWPILALIAAIHAFHLLPRQA